MIKLVVLAVPTFVMGYFKFPKTLCSELEQMVANFWWGQKEIESKIHWVGWDKVCMSKFHGGLAFKNLSTFNLALLTKQGCKVLQDECSLPQKVNKAKNFPCTYFFESQLGHSPSYAWCGIWMVV